MKRLVLVAVVLVLPVLAVRAAQALHLLPVWLDPVDEETAGEAGWAGGRGAAVLLVPDAAPQVSGFQQGEWTYGWINFLQQEVGPYQVRRPAEIAEAAPSILVVPRVLAAAPTAEILAASESGATVVVECPGDGWRSRLGSTSPRQPLRLETVGSARLARPLRALLAPCPAAETLGEVLAEDEDGRPLIWRATGEGASFVGLGFDLSLSILAMQQGVPAESLQVENRFPDRHGPLLQTSDLVFAEELLDSSSPEADRLERLAGQILDDSSPRPRLWVHPGAATGVFVMTHDDEAFGDRSRWMTEYEARIGARSTTLLQPGKHLTAEGVAAMIADGSEAGLHWNRLPRAGADYESTAFLGVEWARRRTSLAQQSAWLRSLLPAGAVLESCRTHFLTWGPDYGSAFRILVAQGYVTDSSYGVDFGERGYLFGTGGPFQAIDRNGLPLPVWEIPHVMAEDLAADSGWLDRMLAASETSEHQVVNVLFHPSDLDWRPSVGLYRLWKGSYDLAAAHGHAILTLSEVTGFWRRRLQSRVEIERVDSGLLVHAEVEGEGHAVALPASWNGARLEIPGRRILRLREETRETILVPVAAGRSTFAVRLVRS